jgi:hypothetical protein
MTRQNGAITADVEAELCPEGARAAPRQPKPTPSAGVRWSSLARDPPLRAASYAPALARRTGRVQARPRTRSIWEMSVYLFFGGAALEEAWDPDPAAVVAKADAKWPAIRDRLAAR